MAWNAAVFDDLEKRMEKADTQSRPRLRMTQAIWAGKGQLFPPQEMPAVPTFLAIYVAMA